MDDLFNQFFVNQKLIGYSDFYKNNCIIAQPNIIWKVVDRLNIQNEEDINLQMLSNLIEILKKRKQNSICLIQDTLIQRNNQNYSFIDELFSIIEISFSKNHLQVIPKIIDLIQILLFYNNIERPNIQKLIKETVKDFYANSLKGIKILTQIRIFQEIFLNQSSFINDPQSFFYFNGPQSGIRLESAEKIKWPFEKGITICIWFQLEEVSSSHKHGIIYISGSEYQKKQQLMFEIYARGPNIYYNSTNNKKEILLAEIKYNEWYYFGIEVEYLKLILHNTYKFCCFLNGELLTDNANIEFPKFKVDNSLDQLVIGENMVGRISSCLIFKNPIGSHNFNSLNMRFGFQNESSLKYLPKIINNVAMNVFLLYTPIRASFKNGVYTCYDAVHSQKNKGIFLTNTGYLNKHTYDTKLQYYGGLQNLLPYVYILRFCEPEYQQDIMNELLKLFVIIFKNKSDAQQDARSQHINFFQIITMLLNQHGVQFFNQNTIEIIAEMRQCLKDKLLKEQFFQDFIWGLQIVQNVDIEVIEDFYRYVRTIYLINPVIYTQLFGIGQIIEYFLDNVESQIKVCCPLHGQLLNDEKEEHEKDIYYRKIHAFLDIIERTMLIGQENLTSSISSLIKCFTLQYSPCFIMYTLDLIQKLISKDDQEQKQITTSMLQSKGVQSISIALQFCPCPMVKTLCVQFIAKLITSNKQINEHEIANLLIYSLQAQSKLQKDILSLEQEEILHLTDNEPMYKAIMEWVLYRQGFVDDADQIGSLEGFYLLMEFYKICNLELQTHIFRDLYMLVIKNKNNAQFLLSVNTFIEWILETLLDLQNIQFTQELSANQKLLQDIGIKIISIIIKYSFETEQYGYQRIYSLIATIERIKLKKTNAINTLVYISGRFLVRSLWMKLVQSIQGELKNKKGNKIFFKNFQFFIYQTTIITIGLNLDGEQFSHTDIQQETNNTHFFFHMNHLLFIVTQQVWIPKNFKSYHQWIDFDIIFQLQKSFEAFYEQYNISKYNNQELMQFFNYQHSKDLESLYDTFYSKFSITKCQSTWDLQNKQLNQDESINNIHNRLDIYFIESLFILLTLQCEYTISQNDLESLQEVVKNITGLFKINIIAIENMRDLRQIQAQQWDEMKGIVLNVISFFYTIRNANPSLNIIQDALVDMGEFFLRTLNITYQMFNNLEQNKHIPKFKNLLYHICEELLVDCRNEKIINFAELDILIFNKLKDKAGIILSDNWDFAFRENPEIDDFLIATILPDYSIIKQDFHNHIDELKTTFESIQMEIQNNNIEIRRKFQTELFDLKSENSQEEENRQFLLFDFQKNKNRNSRKIWHDIWSNSRAFGWWSHPDIDKFLQKNQNFKEENVFYEEQESNQYFYYKVSKYLTKSLSRPLLKIKLKEPQFLIDDYTIQLNKINEEEMLCKDHKGQKQEEENIFMQEIQGKKSSYQTLLQNFKLFYNKKKTDQTLQQKYQNINYKCQWIKSLTIRSGYLKIEQDQLSFCFNQVESVDNIHRSFLKYRIPVYSQLTREWNINLIYKIYRKRYILKKNSLELMFRDGTSLLFNFVEKNEDLFVQCLHLVLGVKDRSLIREVSKSYEKNKKIKKWMSYEITNFTYLMQLCLLAERSYKDITQYPVFPWILRNYESENLDLNDISNYRELNKVVGAIGGEKRAFAFSQRYELSDPFNPVPPYHYGSHYSSPAIIFQFLIRLYPFTTGAKELQSGKFDIPDRLFSCVEECFHNAIEEMTDVRELIPEFFYMPEMFLNNEKHDFGIAQNSDRVHNVKLPLWCKNNPYLFIVIHRKALESDSVSRDINHWIDLIFGYKQRGEEAIKNLNTYYYLTYENALDLDTITDPKEKISIESQIIHFGQCPSQLFQNPHLKKNNTKDIYIFNKLITDEKSKIENCYKFTKTEKNSFKNIQKQNKSEKIFDPKSIIYIKFIGENKLITIAQEGTINFFKLQFAGNEQNLDQIYTYIKEKEKKIDIFMSKDNESYQISNQLSSMSIPLAITENIKFAFIGGFYGGVVNIFNVEQEKFVFQLKYTLSPVSALSIDHKEEFMICGTIQGEVMIIQLVNIELNNFQLIRTFNDHDSEILNISLVKDMRGFLTCSLDGKANLYNLYNLKMMRSYYHPKYLPILYSLISINPLYSVLFYSHVDTTWYCYSINGQMLASKNSQNQIINNPQIFKDSRLFDILIYGYQDINKIEFLNLPFLNAIRVINYPDTFPMQMCFTVSKDRKFLVCGADNGELIISVDPTIIETQAHNLLQNIL